MHFLPKQEKAQSQGRRERCAAPGRASTRPCGRATQTAQGKGTLESPPKVGPRCPPDPYEGSRQTRAFCCLKPAGGEISSEHGLSESLPRVQAARTEPGCLSPGGCPQQRGKGSFYRHFCSLLSHLHCCFLLAFIYYLPQYHEEPSASPVSAPSPGFWSKAGHFSWLGDGRKRAPCTLTVSQHAPREAQDALSYYTGDSPPTPDPTACLHLKPPLCHFIFKTSCRLEDLFSSRLIPQTIRRELLNSGSSRPLGDYVELCLAAPFFGCGRFKISSMGACKTSYSYVVKSDRGPVKRNELNFIPS